MHNNETSIFNLRYFATFILVLFCIRYIPLESRGGPSMIKTVVSGLAFFIMLATCFRITKGLIFGFLYFFTVLYLASIHPETFRWSTILYRLSFVMVFVSLYNLVWVKQVFTIEYFIEVVSKLIFAYTIVLIIQQLFLIVGIKIFPLVNFCQDLGGGIRANSLSGEPSTAARLLGVLYYAYLKCNEYYIGQKLSIKDIFKKEHRFVTIAFLWSMLTMGSGTAFICLGILSLYFMRGWGFLLTFPILLVVIALLSYTGNESFSRAHNAIETASTGDIENFRETDTSAGARIIPMLNTLNIDLSKGKSWIGEGVDATNKYGNISHNRYLGDINEFGIICYIISLILVFGCCIRFFSLGTIMFFLGVGGGTVNIAYAWGILMIFMCIRYFYDNQFSEIVYEEELEENSEECTENIEIFYNHHVN